MFQVLKNQSPARIFSLGFALIILLGSALLMLPISVNEGVDLNYMDALYTSTSAVCVTGLIAVDTADTFTVFGRTVVALLIQIGGLGVTVVGAGIILAIGKKINLKGRRLIKEAMNLDSGKGMIRFIKGRFAHYLCVRAFGSSAQFCCIRSGLSGMASAGHQRVSRRGGV